VNKKPVGLGNTRIAIYEVRKSPGHWNGREDESPWYAKGGEQDYESGSLECGLHKAWTCLMKVGTWSAWEHV